MLNNHDCNATVNMNIAAKTPIVVSSRDTSKANAHSEKDAIVLHAAFLVTAFASIMVFLHINDKEACNDAASSSSGLGILIWCLVISWYALIISIAILQQNKDWLHLLQFLFPNCIFFIFPDGFLAKVLDSIHFPDMGVGRIMDVTSFMPFMWAIPLFMTTMVGRALDYRGYGTYRAALGAGIAGLVVMGGSEAILTQIPIWHATHCTMVGPVALYTLFPEACLGMTTFLGWKFFSNNVNAIGISSLIVHLFILFMVMCMYLGNLIVCYMIIEGGKFRYSCHSEKIHLAAE
mmetsp:Transcript_10684/g.14410  ORF Transcript_10684/g.14410 Transcript_10684/m.14410 type:complete len:291 (+) Transcript_10684:69-941(+)